MHHDPHCTFYSSIASPDPVCSSSTNPAPNPVQVLVNPQLLKLATSPCILGKVAQRANAIRAGGAGVVAWMLGGGPIDVLASAGGAVATEVGLAAVECAQTGEYVP